MVPFLPSSRKSSVYNKSSVWTLSGKLIERKPGSITWNSLRIIQQRVRSAVKSVLAFRNFSTKSGIKLPIKPNSVNIVIHACHGLYLKSGQMSTTCNDTALNARSRAARVSLSLQPIQHCTSALPSNAMWEALNLKIPEKNCQGWKMQKKILWKVQIAGKKTLVVKNSRNSF